jgi:ribosome-associated protein
MTEAAEKKDVQKLQRVIVDALEDVKAVNIAVYNTEHLSSLFERVILASGTSNRQTKALAANVRDEVRKSGHGKPRIEGEENGEWIIVDCGAAVVHIMQPNIREYYNLEEIWGDKPVRLKFGAPRPVFAQAQEPKEQKKASSSKTASKTASKSGSKTGSKTPSKTGSGKTSPPARPGSSRSSAAPKNSRSRKGASRGLQTAVDPKTGLTVPVNNSRRAIDKRPYLAELPAESPKASAPARGTQKTSTAASKSKATPPLKPPSKAPSKSPSRAPARSSSPVSGKSAPKPRAAAPSKPAAKRTTKKA